VVRWEMALIATDDPKKLKDGEFFGYGVDAGMGAFADATSVDAIKRVGATDGLLARWIPKKPARGTYGTRSATGTSSPSTPGSVTVPTRPGSGTRPRTSRPCSSRTSWSWTSRD
jgi:hypothetical protein